MKRIADAIERRAGLTAEQFYEGYLRPELPVVLTDVTTAWPATTKWTEEYLTERFGDRPVRAYHHPDALYTAWKRMRVDTTLGAVIEGADPRTWISASLFDECAYLIDDIEVPPLLRPESVMDEASLWVQPAGQRTGLHWDTYSSFISVLRGRKRVVLFSPDQFEDLYPCLVTGAKDFTMGSWSRMDVFAPDLDAFPRARNAAYYEVVLDPGETLLIPSHWWHAVENLGTPTIAVSFFVDRQGKPELTFYYDRRIIAGLSINQGILTGSRRTN